MNIGSLITENIWFQENVAHLDISFVCGRQRLTFTIIIDEETGIPAFDPNAIYGANDRPVQLTPEEMQTIQEIVNATVIQYLMNKYRWWRFQRYYKSHLHQAKLLEKQCSKRGITLIELSGAVSVPLEKLQGLNNPDYESDFFLNEIDAICSYFGIPLGAWFSNSCKQEFEL